MAAVEVPPLIEILAEIPDTRQRQALRHSLAGMLTLACVATLCGYESPSAIAEWGHNYGEAYARVFGFETHGYPSRATWYRVFGEVDIEQVETRLTQWCEWVLRALGVTEEKLIGLSIDGKTLRGSKRQANAHLAHQALQTPRRLPIWLYLKPLIQGENGWLRIPHKPIAASQISHFPCWSLSCGAPCPCASSAFHTPDNPVALPIPAVPPLPPA
jgi:hypothetical protein